MTSHGDSKRRHDAQLSGPEPKRRRQSQLHISATTQPNDLVIDPTSQAYKDAEYEWQEYHRAQGVDLLPNSRIPPEDYDGYIRWHLTKQENKRRINETLERRGINRADQPDVPIKTEEKQQTEESEAPIGTAQRREDSPYPDSSLLHDEWYRMLHGALTDED
ncbi:uncharacterized protein BKA78DRAFT_357473 [Phyllosticta capitalensis]|uniref:uncharacterized protein n=1 Tax=Phyllosticta capitalensis TaxID=121624 RepID=UPI0031305EF6